MLLNAGDVPGAETQAVALVKLGSTARGPPAAG